MDVVAEFADVIQIGARNMQNFSLLKKVGAQEKLSAEAGMAATIEDWLMRRNTFSAAGNPNVILCERGIRTFDRQYARIRWICQQFSAENFDSPTNYD
jgi:3-deoxy-7-phosphoheptulonate synthase